MTNGESWVHGSQRCPPDRRALTAVDVFAGCGGLTRGLRAAGFKVLGAVEKDPDAAATYKANNRDVILYRKDIQLVRPKLLLRALDLPKGEALDLIAGCPPCQGFTRLTEHRGSRDPRNQLVREFLRFVTVIRPKACMFENVPGLLTRGIEYFEELCKGLEAAGYFITYKVVQLADYGVPQFRKRLVLLASRLAPIAIPPPTHHDPARSPKAGCLRPWRTVRDTIEGLPSPPLRSEVRARRATPRYKWHFARDVAPIVRRRLEHGLNDGKAGVSLPLELRLACQERRDDGYSDVYGVMDWDSPSPTITSGCTNASKGRFGHPAEPRPITAMEAALLQTFLVSDRFCDRRGLESVAAQIGNAFPPRAAKVFGRAISESLA